MDATPAIIPVIRDTAGAGGEISSAVLKLLSAPRQGPNEVHDLAKAVSDLSGNTSRIARVWPAPKFRSPYAAKEELEQHVARVMELIATLHRGVGDLIDPGNAAARLLWAFRRARWRALLLQADACNAGVNIISNTMVLAEHLRHHHAYVSAPERP